MKTILATGLSGRIGRKLLPALCKQFRVISIGRSSLDFEGIHHIKISSYGNLEELARSLEQVERVDSFLHLGANVTNRNEDFSSGFLEEFTFLQSLLSVILPMGLKRIDYASSYMVYGRSNDHIFSERSLPKPSNYYGALKVLMEECLSNLARSNQLQFVALRISGVFGLDDPNANNLIPKLIRDVQKGERVFLANQGDIHRDYIHVDDLCRSIVTILNSACEGVFNIGSEARMSALEIYQLIQERSSVSALLEIGGSLSKDLDILIDCSLAKATFSLPHIGNDAIRLAILREVEKSS